MLMKNERCLIKEKKIINKKIVRICLLMIGFIFTTGFYYDNNIYADLEEITIELGDMLPTEKMIHLSNLLADKNLAIEDTVPKDEYGYSTKTGTYNYYVVYLDNERMYSKVTNQQSIINVIDTIKPVIKIKEDKTISLNYGTKFDISKYAECYDIAPCELKVLEKVNTKKSGTKEITVVATDESGNTNQQKIKIKVKKKPVYNWSSSTSSKLNAKNNILNNTLTEGEKINLRYRLIEFAKQFVGNPYVYGGTSLTNGTDCSGFTMSVYANFGYSLPRSALSQSGVGRQVSASELLPGDLIVWHYPNGGGHVGIYLEGNKMIHAGTAKTGIVIANIFSGTKTYHRVIY